MTTIPAITVREAVDIVSLIEEYVPLRPGGRELIGKCPFHEDSTPSFAVNADKQLWHCHGCGVGGDVIAFEERIRGLSFQDALQSLAERFGLHNTTQPTMQQRASWAQRKADADLIGHHRLLYAVPEQDAAMDFYRECERDPTYRTWLECDLQKAMAVCSVIVGLIAKAQARGK